MKRLSSSDSLGALISISPTTEFQCMLDEEGFSGHVSEKKRRLSEDQVKALEKNFEIENKLEPERKVKLAQELGLQPRQVAVWFQNRRARWKTKQLERDYGVLKSNYDSLRLRVDSLKHDNETLLTEVKDLRSKLNEDNAKGQISIKEEEVMVSESENNEIIEQQSEPKSNFEGFKVSVMADLKDGSSDSDSSAILHEEHSPIAANSPFQDHCIFPCFPMGSSDSNQRDYEPQLVKMEERNFFGGEEDEESCNFFSEDQAPTLQWNFCADHWN